MRSTMRSLLLAVASLMLAITTLGQTPTPVAKTSIWAHIDPPKPKTDKYSDCSTHERQFKHPTTWMASDMCQADYDKWLRDHANIVNRPFYKDPGHLVGDAGIITAWLVEYRATEYTERGFDPSKPYTDQCIFSKSGCPVGHQWDVAMTAAGISSGVGLNILSYYLGRRDPSHAWRILSKVLVPAVEIGLTSYASTYKFKTGLDNPFPTKLAQSGVTVARF